MKDKVLAWFKETAPVSHSTALLRFKNSNAQFKLSLEELLLEGKIYSFRDTSGLGRPKLIYTLQENEKCESVKLSEEAQKERFEIAIIGYIKRKRIVSKSELAGRFQFIINRQEIIEDLLSRNEIWMTDKPSTRGSAATIYGWHDEPIPDYSRVSFKSSYANKLKILITEYLEEEMIAPYGPKDQQAVRPNGMRKFINSTKVIKSGISLHEMRDAMNAHLDTPEYRMKFIEHVKQLPNTTIKLIEIKHYIAEFGYDQPGLKELVEEWQKERNNIAQN